MSPWKRITCLTPPTATSGAHGLAARAITAFGLAVVTTGSVRIGFSGIGTTSGLPRLTDISPTSAFGLTASGFDPAFSRAPC